MPQQDLRVAQIPSSSVILAAGGIIVRNTNDGEEVLILHRKRYDDWTLPKGKLQTGESFEEAALREVKEETGCTCELGEYVQALGYEVKGQPKVVLFWRMRLLEQQAIEDAEEVAEAVWISTKGAAQRLSHEGERRLLSAVMAHDYESPKDLRLERPTMGTWFRRRREFARLFRELETSRIELAFLNARSQSPAKTWVMAAEDHFNAALHYWESKDIEGAWVSLHAARRRFLFGLEEPELEVRASMLRDEAQKLPSSSWRRTAIENLLAPTQELTADRVAEAAAVRDEYFSNAYYKIGLKGDQLAVLLTLCSVAALFLLPPIVGKPMPVDFVWDRQMTAAVLLFGLLGAGFSAAQSLMSDSGSSRIPESVAAAYITVARTLFGAIAGLASYAFLASKLISINAGNGTNKASLALAVAFVFGYLGEKAVARIAGSVSGGKGTS